MSFLIFLHRQLQEDVLQSHANRPEFMQGPTALDRECGLLGTAIGTHFAGNLEFAIAHILHIIHTFRAAEHSHCVGGAA